MRVPLSRLTAALSAITVLALTAAVAMAGSGHPAARTAAHLTVVKAHPLTVRGAGFAPRSHVTVTLSSAHTVSRAVTASQTGTFTVAFTTTVDRCTQWLVTAKRRGAAPVVLHGPKPMCAPMGGY